jgi:hypothetical protein
VRYNVRDRILRFNVRDLGSVVVHSVSAEPDETPNYVRYAKQGLDALDETQSVDLMQGVAALEAYLAEDTERRVVNAYLDDLEDSPLLSSSDEKLESSEAFQKIKWMDHVALPALSEVLEASAKKTPRADIAAKVTAKILAYRMLSSQYAPPEIVSRAQNAYKNYTGEEAPLFPSK